MRPFVDFNNNITTQEAEQLSEDHACRLIINDIFDENSIDGSWDNEITKSI